VDILNSDWLPAKLEKSGGSPRQRLLGLFDVLDNWLQAPQLPQQLQQAASQTNVAPPLLHYLTRQGRILRVPAPEALAHQLYFMAHNALQQEMAAPGCRACFHARKAAQALLDAQLPAARSRLRSYGLAAGLLIIAGFSSYLALGLQSSAPDALAPYAETESSRPAALMPAHANPVHTAEMYASLERMRGGVCHYYEALMLPEGQQGIYLRNVVGGEVSTDASNQALAARLMQRVHCDYAPMLMKNSTS
jgi:hypothetical protein